MGTAIQTNDSPQSDMEQLQIRLAELEGEVVQLRARTPALIEADSVRENASDGFVVYDAGFAFVYLNSDGERLLGKPKGVLLGKTQWEVFPETVGTELERHYRVAMKERRSEVFTDFSAERNKWSEIRLAPSQNGGLLVWLRDITAHQQAEIDRETLHQGIQTERQILSQIIENAAVAISVVRAPDFVFELVNPAFQAFMPGKEILGHTFSDVWGDGSEGLVASLNGVIAAGKGLDLIDSPRMVHRSPETPPETIYVSSSWIPLIGPAGVPDRVLILSTQTTERKKQEDLLRASEARLARAQGMANLGNWEQDLASGEMQLSADACHIFGFPDDAGRCTMETLLAIVHRDDEVLVRENIQRAAAQGGVSEFNHRIILSDGTERFVRQYVDRFNNETGPNRLVGTVQDVTEYKHLEEKFRCSQKLEAIARLAGGVAHDINNLLVVINGYAEMIVSDLKPGDPLQDEAKEINAGNRAAALTRQLLAFSRKQAMRPRVINLDRLLGDFQKLLSRLIPANIEIKQNLTPGLWSIKGDPDQIEQVIMNLTVNARDAMPTGGRLTINTANVELGAREIKGFFDLKPGRYISVTITDTGTGMTAETKRRLFEPFFTTKALGEGTGLGLSMVYGIVKQHGGEISCHSEIGVGTTFKMYWPVTDQSNEVPPTLTRARTAYLGNETIMLVEDDEKVRKFVKQILSLQGYQVLETLTSTDAVDVAAKHEGAIDLLLTDVVMPHMSGRDLAKKVVALRPDIKVMFMSGYPGGVTADHSVFDHDSLFLQKPFDKQTLSRLIRQAFGSAAPGMAEAGTNSLASLP